MGFTILESGEFMRGFVGDVVVFDAFCKELERNYSGDIVRRRLEDTRVLVELEQADGHVNSVANKKELALTKCKEKLESIFRRDKERLGTVYAKITNAKLSGDLSNLESLRAELFVNKEKVKEERDAVWLEYQTSCATIARSFESGQNEKNKKISDKRVELSKEFKKYDNEHITEKQNKINGKIDEFNAKFGPETVKKEYVDIYADEPFVENYECKDGDNPPEIIRIGTLSFDVSALKFETSTTSLIEEHYPMLYTQGKINIPYCTAFGESFNYRFTVSLGNTKGRELLVNRACS
jgi:hypothetical protein